MTSYHWLCRGAVLHSALWPLCSKSLRCDGVANGDAVSVAVIEAMSGDLLKQQFTQDRRYALVSPN